MIKKFENYVLDGRYHFQNYEKADQGRARYVFVVDDILDDTESFWMSIHELSKDESLPVKVLGGGTNVLIAGDYFEGIVVKVDYPDASCAIEGDTVVSMSGVPLDAVVNKVAEHGFDMSILAGIPGTIGGAVYGNAGSSTWNRNIGEITQVVRIFNIESGEFSELNVSGDDSFFSWRSNRLKEQNHGISKYLIRSVVLIPPRGETHDVRQKIQERYVARHITDVEGVGTAGSFFASAILPVHLQSLLKEKTLVRDLIAQCPVLDSPDKTLSTVDVNGAHFTPKMAFLKTDARTTDADIAKLLDITLQSMQAAYGFVPTKEVDILGKTGSYTLDDFITTQSD